MTNHDALPEIRAVPPASNERLRLLFWADSFWPAIGGLEVWAARFVRGLSRLGHEVTVVTTHTGLDVPDRDEYHGIPVHRFPLWSAAKSSDPRRIAEARSKVARLREAVRPHCVHVNMCGPTILFYLLTRHIAPAPSVFTLHGEWPARYAEPGSLLARSLDDAGCVVAVSEATLAWARKVNPAVAPRASVIPHAFEGFRGFTRSGRRGDAAPRRLLCLGRLSQEKGFDVALRAFARITRAIPDAVLTIAGDGMERGPLEALARELGIRERVRFAGWVSPRDVPALIQDSAVVLIPSRAEGFGLAALEAAWMGRPVVAAAVGGLLEVVDDGATGVLVPPDDPARLADATLELLQDADRRAAMGRRARRAARGRGGWSEHVNAYDALFRQLAGDVRQDGTP